MIIDCHAHIVAPETLYAYKGNLIANAGATGFYGANGFSSFQVELAKRLT